MPRIDLPATMHKPDGTMMNIFDMNGAGFLHVLRFATGVGNAIATGTNPLGRQFAPRSGIAVGWMAAAEVNGASGGFSFDILQNGVSILTTPAVVPVSTTSLQSGKFGWSSATGTWGVDSVGVTEGDIYTVNISGVGGSPPTGVQINLILLLANQK